MIQPFTKLCRLVYPWENVSKIQSIKKTVIASPMTDNGTVCIMHNTSEIGASMHIFGATVSDQVPKLKCRHAICSLLDCNAHLVMLIYTWQSPPGNLKSEASRCHAMRFKAVDQFNKVEPSQSQHQQIAERPVSQRFWQTSRQGFRQERQSPN